MTTKADEQERARFKAHYEGLFDLTETTDAWGQPKFAHEHIESIWAGWKARADLQSQDREDAGMAEIVREAAQIIAAIPPEHAPDNIRWPIVDELEGFASKIDRARRGGGES
ncbi:hypothetical protein G5B41_17535 [bacterium SGD-2]|nr:hypothetical protein [bacterium SGD-2]